VVNSVLIEPGDSGCDAEAWLALVTVRITLLSDRLRVGPAGANPKKFGS